MKRVKDHYKELQCDKWVLAIIILSFNLGECADLIINDVVANRITSSGANIVWKTSAASDSQLEYGIYPFYGMTTPLNISLVTSHSIFLRNLSQNSLYHYRFKSRDETGNLQISPDYTFSTSQFNQDEIINATLPFLRI